MNIAEGQIIYPNLDNIEQNNIVTSVSAHNNYLHMNFFKASKQSHPNAMPSFNQRSSSK